MTITLSQEDNQEDNNEPVAEHGGINHARVYPMSAVRRWTPRFPNSNTESRRRYGRSSLLALRASLGVVFIWFGALKVANVTPVAALVAGTVPWVDPAWFVPLLGTVEVVVGVALIAGRRLTVVSFVLVAHLTGTLLVFVMEPQVAFEHGNPLLLTTVGEFVMKNVVLISAGLVLASRQDARRRGAFRLGGRADRVGRRGKWAVSGEMHQPRTAGDAKGKIMRSVLGQLMIWMGEMLDRSLITVPEVDEDFPPFTADRQDHGSDAEADTNAHKIDCGLGLNHARGRQNSPMH